MSYKDINQNFPIRVYSIAVDVASVAANTTAEQDITVTGVSVSDEILNVVKPSLSAGLGIANARIKAADTIAVTFINATAGAIDPASETYKFMVAKMVP